MKTASITTLISRLENTGRIRIETGTVLKPNSDESAFVRCCSLRDARRDNDYSYGIIDLARTALRSGEQMAKRYERRDY